MKRIREKMEFLVVFAICLGLVLGAWACALMMVGAFLGEPGYTPSEAQVQITLDALEKEGE